MSDPIRVFVGSDIYQQQVEAEATLEHTIRKHASMPVEITWMRAGDTMPVSNGPKPGHWNICREPGQAWPKTGHGTDFSVFRMMVPEMAGFHGKAIYLDVDMILLGDIAELWNMPQKAPYLCNSKGRTEVALIDCEAFGNADWWPRIASVQQTGTYLPTYRNMLAQRGWIDESLPWEWNACDKMLPGAKLLHATSVPHQPFRPYPNMKYHDHPDVAFRDAFLNARQEMRERASATAG